MSTTRSAILANLASAVNGISNLSAYRYQQEGVKAAFPYAVVQWQGDTAADGPTSHYFSRRLRAAVYLFFQTQVTDPVTTSDEQAEIWLARIEHAVMADRIRGGNAIDTLLGETIPHPAIEGQPDVGGVVHFEITYQASSLTPD